MSNMPSHLDPALCRVFLQVCDKLQPKPNEKQEVALKRLWLKFQYWMLMYLFRRHREFDRISSAGPPSGHYDTYWVFVLEDRTVRGDKTGRSERRYSYLIKHSSQGHLLAQQMRETDNVEPYPRFKIGPEFFHSKRLELQHYYRDASFAYRSVLRCFLARLFALDWLCWIWGKASEVFKQWLYTKRFRLVNDRIEVLRSVIELNDEGLAEPPGFDVARRLHGDRFILMDGHEKVTATVERLLESLVADGYLQKTANGYHAPGKAMAGLLALQAELRRERQARFSQIMMVVLTMILAISSAMATWFMYLDLENKPF